MALNRSVDGQSSETKHRHIVTAETLFHDHGRAAVFDRGRAQCVKSENTFRLTGRRGDKAFRAATVVVLASILLQIEIEFGRAAVKGSAVMVPRKRRFLPDQRRHLSLKPALAARTKRSPAFGGFSKSSRTRKESRSESFNRSDSAISASA